MAMDYAEACRMIGAAREAGRMLGIAYYRRMYPKLQRARELVADGAIGRPVLAVVNCHDWYTDSDNGRCWRLDPAMPAADRSTTSHRTASTC